MAETPTPPPGGPPPPPPGLVPPPGEGVLVEGPAKGPGGDSRSLGDLFGELATETTTLVRQEVALAKKEIREEIRTVAKNVAEIVAGGALAYAGLIVLLTGLGLLLGELLFDAEWLGLLVVGALVAAVGGALAKKGLDTLKRMDPTPERTLETLKEDKEWLKHQTP
jgi:hypothetical protein